MPIGRRNLLQLKGRRDGAQRMSVVEVVLLLDAGRRIDGSSFTVGDKEEDSATSICHHPRPSTHTHRR